METKKMIDKKKNILRSFKNYQSRIKNYVDDRMEYYLKEREKIKSKKIEYVFKQDYDWAAKYRDLERKTNNTIETLELMMKMAVGPITKGEMLFIVNGSKDELLKEWGL